ncbi:hypothetical protein PG999_013015 [Apiospora kogelbergensis]|uniref:2-oxoadipate dioxygenase/decarboxylase n=1 Tax=Apiospora kogelbergensis TaxID=1337665 RepID=A0AAW0QCN6_9PEZI
MLHATPIQHLHLQVPALDVSLIRADDLRTAFAAAMSQMYKNEVPRYGDLVRIVQEVNQAALSGISSWGAGVSHATTDSPERLSLERHGAIRLGLPSELRTVRRIFAVLGMYPVGYYDLSVAGLPMHATCFRPTTPASLARNPFRVFTSLLRPDLVKSEDGTRELALQLLSRRTLFSPELLSVLDRAERQEQGLYAEQAEIFIREALQTFSWANGVAASTADEYARLSAEHPVLADIACFRTAHINHLTPRALDIDAAQRAMVGEGMSVKERIEGPPRRRFPILLRQTSFLAIHEPVHFLAEQDSTGGLDERKMMREDSSTNQRLVKGSHCARFGEIEERGAAVTAAGRRLYDNLLAETTAQVASHETNANSRTYDKVLTETFRGKYPDDLGELCRQRLIFCQYRCTGLGDAIDANVGVMLDWAHCLVDEGVLVAEPITYEDFLPFSAAGIFQSNLQRTGSASTETTSKQSSAKSGPARIPSLVEARGGDKDSLEEALGVAITDPDVLYAQAQKDSLLGCLKELGLNDTL